MPAFHNNLLLFLLMIITLSTQSILLRSRHRHSSFIVMSKNNKRKAQLLSTPDSTEGPPLYKAQGLVAVHKPLTWTSQDVVSYIRGIITRDAQDRNALVNSGGGNKRGRKKQMMKVGHGGTLDPLASGECCLCSLNH